MVFPTTPVSLAKDLFSIAKGKPEKSQAQVSCEAKGGRWDGQNCIMPEPKPEPKPEPAPTTEPQPQPTPRAGEVITDAETGEPKGYINSQGEYVKASRADIQNVVNKRQAKFAPITGGVTFQQRVQEEAIATERERLITEETPQRRELDPEMGILEDVPVLGGLVGASRRLIGTPLKKALGIKLNQADPDITPEQLRTFALTEIERQEVERGLTLNEKFGEFVEAIPLAGSLASKYAGGLIETPSENAKQVKANILKERRRIANIETNVKLGYLPVSVAQEQITDIESNVQRLESRMRLLINHSPELRFNSDYVNTVETEILATREKAFQAKQNILEGATQNPDEIQLLKQLQLNEEPLEE